MKSALDAIEDTSDAVLDASVMINLLGTGRAQEILRAFEFRCAMDRRALAEITRHPRPEGKLEQELRSYTSSGIIQELALTDGQNDDFIEIVGAPAPNGLGDGEAATLVQAASSRSVAIIDERKARRVGRQRYPRMNFALTIDLIMHRSVLKVLGASAVKMAVSEALKYSRMYVPGDYARFL